MKAIVQDRYGSADRLRLEEVARPALRDDGVLVRIEAASVNAADWHLMRADPFFLRLIGFGLLRPRYRIPGADIAGRVEAVGKSVRSLRPGDEVFGDLSSHGFGAFSEYVCVPAEALAPKPSNLSFEQAACVPLAGLAALQGLRDGGRVQAGQRVLINGAAGGVGTFAVQIALALGAEVTGVCSARNLELVRSLGAHHVIDYSREDITRSGQTHDVIFDAAAYRSPLDHRRILTPGGTYVLIGGATRAWLQAALASLRFGDRKLIMHSSRPNARDLLALKELCEAGKVTPRIEHRYPLAEVPEAIRQLETGHGQGKTAIRMGAGA